MRNGGSSSRRDRRRGTQLVAALLLVLVVASFGFPVVTLVAASVLAVALLIGSPLRLVLRRRSAERADVAEAAPDLESALRPERVTAERRSLAPTSDGSL